MFHRLHLSSSAASVPVECMFSSAGLVANRRIYWQQKLHHICFVHDNYKWKDYRMCTVKKHIKLQYYTE